jgi:hypothetical protein
MRIAYLILAHDQPALFGRLVRAVSGPHAVCFAHIDAKSDAGPFRAAAGAAVRFVEGPVKVNWGGYSQVQAMLALIALAHGHGPFDYYVFLSGRDYPIRGSGELLDFLAAGAGTSYMNFYPLVEGTDFVSKVRNYCYYDWYARLPTRFLRRVANRAVRTVSGWLPPRRFIDGMTPYRGSTSWCLAGPVIEYLVAFLAGPRAPAYTAFFKSVNCCDEIFFQTLVLNSPHRNTLRYFERDIVQRRPGEMKNENKASLHYIDWNPAREDPAILVADDLDPMRASGKFFARKFDEHRSVALLDQLDAACAEQPDATA